MTRLRQLGRSTLAVTPIGLGCWQFSGRKNIAGKFWPDLPKEEVRSIVRASLEGGINWFDTAEVYGGGASERALADALRAAGKDPGQVVIATKWWPAFRTAASITKTIDDRRACLEGYPIDLHQVHQPFALSSVEAQMAAMAHLVRDRQIRAVGVSNFSARKMRRAHVALERQGLFLATNQVKYSLLDRRIESDGTVDVAQELGVSLVAYSPLEQGLLSGKFHDDPALVRGRPGPRRFLPAFQRQRVMQSLPLIEGLREIGARRGATASQVALSWLVSFHGDRVVAIVGATRVSHAEEAAGALALALEPEELERIDDLSRRCARW